MGGTLIIEGIRNTKGKFDEMIKHKKYCEAHNLSYPKEVIEYFGKLVDESEEIIQEEMLVVKLPLKKYRDMEHSFELNVKEIPTECEKIRIYISA